jgi:ribosomal protein L15
MAYFQMTTDIGYCCAIVSDSDCPICNLQHLDDHLQADWIKVRRIKEEEFESLKSRYQEQSFDQLLSGKEREVIIQKNTQVNYYKIVGDGSVDFIIRERSRCTICAIKQIDECFNGEVLEIIRINKDEFQGLDKSGDYG